MSMPGGSEWLLIFIALFVFILPIMALVDLLRSSFKDSTNKIVWAILIVLMPVIGSVLYFFIGKQQKIEN